MNRTAPAWAFRMLLRMYPERLRSSYGADILEAYEDAWLEEAAGRSALRGASFWLRLTGDALRVRLSGGTARDQSLAGNGERAPWTASVLADTRYAFKALAKRPGYAALVVTMLALGIGANAAVFNALHDVVIRPLPYENAERLVRIFEFDGATPERNYVTAPTFFGLRDGMRSLDGLAALYTYRETGADYTDGDRPERIRTLRVSSGYLRVYGTAPFIGREFKRDEERADVGGVFVSHHFWQTRLGGAHDVLGRRLTLDGAAYDIIGVAPEGFVDAVAGPVDAWLNLDLERWREAPGNWYLTLIGRLAPERQLMVARDESERVERALEEQLPGLEDHHPYVVPLHEDIVGVSGRALALLMAAVGIVLVIACVNVAQLMLVRGLGRERELAVRAALGCSRPRLVRQLLLESVILAFGGAAIGLALARIGNGLWLGLAASSLPRAVEASVDWIVIGFCAAVAAVTALLFGVVPALRGSSFDLQRALHEGARGHSAGAGLTASRRLLVAIQLALALMLTAGAGVLTKSFLRLAEVDLRVESEGVLAADVSLPSARYPEFEQRFRVYRQLADRIEALPGVRAAGSVSWLPAQGRYHGWGFYLPTLGDGTWDGSPSGNADQRVVEGRFFEALRIPLLRGRLFEPQDLADAPHVVVVNEELVRRYVPSGVEALGAMVSVADTQRTIVGIVADTAIDPRGDVRPIIYHPHSQMAENRNWLLTQVVAGTGGTARLEAMAAELAVLDPDLVLHDPRELAPLFAEGISREKLLSGLLAAFASIALVLAGLGLYGVLSHAVGQRRREIGVRMALGATAASVRRLIVRQAATVATIGALIGIAGALWASRWVEALVFETSPQDPVTLGAAAAVLVGLTILASYLPTRRATLVDPAEVLRAE